VLFLSFQTIYINKLFFHLSLFNVIYNAVGCPFFSHHSLQIFDTGWSSLFHIVLDDVNQILHRFQIRAVSGPDQNFEYLLIEEFRYFLTLMLRIVVMNESPAVSKHPTGCGKQIVLQISM
jgi:hypothetical protein